MASVITSYGKISEDNWEDFECKIRERLLAKGYSASKIKFIFNVQDYFDSYDFDRLYKSLQGVINGKMRGFINKWGRTYKLDFEDLVSMSNVRLWELYEYCWEGEPCMSYCGEITFYENFIIQMETDILGKFLRTLKTNKRRLSVSAEVYSYEKYIETCGDRVPATNDTEEETLNKITIEEIYNMIGKGVFSENEERILIVIAENPESSYSEMAEKLVGVKHRSQVQRLLESIRKKLKQI